MHPKYDLSGAFPTHMNGVNIVHIDNEEQDLQEMHIATERFSGQFYLASFRNEEDLFDLIDDWPQDVSLPVCIIELNLAGNELGGLNVLHSIRSNIKIRNAYCVIFSHSDSQEHINLCYEAGANLFISKSFQDREGVLRELLARFPSTKLPEIPIDDQVHNLHETDSASDEPDLTKSNAEIPIETEEIDSEIEEAFRSRGALIETYFHDISNIIKDKRNQLRQYRPNSDDGMREKARAEVFLRELNDFAELLLEELETSMASDPEVNRFRQIMVLYYGKIREWPVENADEVVDGIMRTGIIGVCIGAGAIVGYPAVAAGISGAVFGSKAVVSAVGKYFGH